MQFVAVEQEKVITPEVDSADYKCFPHPHQKLGYDNPHGLSSPTFWEEKKKEKINFKLLSAEIFT